ncbi:MAG TPA: DUF5667 domain-containing protein [Chloroflexota bacterium]|nr:DUF5667 domain-containing protein [Chloroflexota bacterium]
MRDEDLLTSCLAELDRRNWDVDAYLAARPDLPVSVQSMLRVASQVKAFPKPAPSPEFRDRISARLAAKIATTPQRRPTRSWFLTLPGKAWFRPVAAPIAASLLVIGGMGGVLTASAAAIPGSAFYPTKLAAEKVQLLFAASPASQAQVHVQIAQSRLQEAQSEIQTGNLNVVPDLLQRSDQALAAAQTEVAHTTSPTERSQIEQKITAVRGEDTKIVPLLTPTETAQPRREISDRRRVVVPSATARSTVVVAAALQQDTPTLTARSDDAQRPAPTAIQSTPRPGFTPISLGNPVQSEVLLHLLIQQATANNTGQALSTAHLYATALQSERTNVGASERLSGERTQIDDALNHVPPASRYVVLMAKEALDSAISGGSNSTASYASVLATATAGPEIEASTPTSKTDGSPTAGESPHAGPPISENGNSRQSGRSRDGSGQPPNFTPTPQPATPKSTTAPASDPQSTKVTADHSGDNSRGHVGGSSNSSDSGSGTDQSSGNTDSHSSSTSSYRQTDQSSIGSNGTTHNNPIRRGNTGRHAYPQATNIRTSAVSSTSVRRGQGSFAKGNSNGSRPNDGSRKGNNSRNQTPTSSSNHQNGKSSSKNSAATSSRQSP